MDITASNTDADQNDSTPPDGKQSVESKSDGHHPHCRNSRRSMMIKLNQISSFRSIIFTFLLIASLDVMAIPTCPIGFEITTTRDSMIPICYRLKGPERFADGFEGCTGNLHTDKLYDLIPDKTTELVLWTEYKAAYAGGPFVDLSFTASRGSLLKTSFKINYTEPGFKEELCVARHPNGIYTAEKCDKLYYRYCFVEPYSEDSRPNEGCEKFEVGFRFYSPKPMCLFILLGISDTGITRAQSIKNCEKEGGDVLYHGWRYSNNQQLDLFTTGSGEYPLRANYVPFLNLTFTSTMIGDSIKWYCDSWSWPDGRKGEIETHPCTHTKANERKIYIDTVKSSSIPKQQLVILRKLAKDQRYGMIRNNVWESVDKSYSFHDIICETRIELKKITLTVKADSENRLILMSNPIINASSNFLCYTDSITFHPSPVKIRYDNSASIYVLSQEKDGQYWCISNDTKRYKASQSNKYLWIKEKESLKYRYAVKISHQVKYTLNTVNKVLKNAVLNLKDYIYYHTMFKNNIGGNLHGMHPKRVEQILKQFAYKHPEFIINREKILYKMILKELYLDAKSFLVHIELDDTMIPVPPGQFRETNIIYMKPVHYCSVEGHQFERKYNHKCKTHSCFGNFNVGVVTKTNTDDICIDDLLPSGTIRSTKLPDFKKTLATERSDYSDYPEDTDLTATTEESTIVPSEFSDYPEYTDMMETIEESTTVPSNYSDNPEYTDMTATTEESITVPIDYSDYPGYTDMTETTQITPTVPPQKQLQQVMKDVELLLKNHTLPMTDIIKPFDQVDGLLAKDVSVEIPSRLLQSLDMIASNIQLNGTNTAKAVRSNFALIVTNANPSLPVNGLSIASSKNDPFTNNAFEIIREEMNASLFSSDVSEAIVRLPTSVATSSRRISFVAFRNDRAFHTKVTSKSVNSVILSINVEDTKTFNGKEVIDIYFRPLSKPLRHQIRSCAHFKFNNDGTGVWSQDGCTFIEASKPGKMDVCQCNHLTHFAEILVSKTTFSKLDEQILEIISVIGCSLSIFGLTIVGVTATIFRSWRKEFNNKIWLQLCLAILLLSICYLITILRKFNSSNPECRYLGIMLHFSVLASFSWMLVAAILSFKRLVMVFSRDASHKLLKASAFAWGFPITVVGILLASAPYSYKGELEDITPTGSFCYPSGLALWITVYAPIALMLLINWTLFILILRSVFGRKSIERHGDTNEAIRCATVSCLLVFIFGLPWIFGLFARNVVAAYFFVVTSSFQGLVLFIFFIIVNRKTRDLWLRRLKITETSPFPVITSTYTTQSTSGYRSHRRGGIAVCIHTIDESDPMNTET